MKITEPAPTAEAIRAQVRVLSTLAPKALESMIEATLKEHRLSVAMVDHLLYGTGAATRRCVTLKESTAKALYRRGFLYGDWAYSDVNSEGYDVALLLLAGKIYEDSIDRPDSRWAVKADGEEVKTFSENWAMLEDNRRALGAVRHPELDGMYSDPVTEEYVCASEHCTDIVRNGSRRYTAPGRAWRTSNKDTAVAHLHEHKRDELIRDIDSLQAAAEYYRDLDPDLEEYPYRGRASEEKYAHSPYPSKATAQWVTAATTLGVLRLLAAHDEADLGPLLGDVLAVLEKHQPTDLTIHHAKPEPEYDEADSAKARQLFADAASA